MQSLGDPIAAFHRELLTILHWSVIREQFYDQFLAKFDPTHVGGHLVQPSSIIEESRKFRRHCKEALGKWILSQKARDSNRSSFYFPTRQSAAQHSTKATYDAQLIRDLTMKCTKEARDAPNFADNLKLFIETEFSLSEKCFRAHEAIEVTVTGSSSPEPKRLRTERAPSASVLAPKITILKDEDKYSDFQKRISGDVVQLSVNQEHFESFFASHFEVNKDLLGSVLKGTSLNKRLAASLTTIIIPLVAWDKLQRLYANAGYAAADGAQYSSIVATNIGQGVDVTQLRCAVLAYRYEANLATGSLQLCADESLKNILANKGYKVIDLCASPINAFQVEGSANEPVHFCSAFADTDIAFGSLGSATTVDLQTYMDRSTSHSRFLFTLDVPYDEDLCNLLFVKLAQETTQGLISQQASFILVLPLWWKIDFEKTPKLHLTSDEIEVGRAMSSAVSYMSEGYQVDYPWPAMLQPNPWASFDAIFVKDSYSYFCTATNKVLSGVTATEVIGFEAPPSQTLQKLLREFYKL